MDPIPEISKIRRIGVMGGSFDPPHLGHRNIAKSFLKSGHIDHLLIVPAPNPPHKMEKTLAPFADRFFMCQLNFQGIDGISISDIENRREGPSYTLLTIQELEKAGHEIVLCIGMDTLVQFTSWYKWEEILKKAPLLVYPREREEILIPAELTKYRDRIYTCRGDLHAHSSTAVRQGRGEALLQASVARYVREKGLYTDH